MTSSLGVQVDKMRSPFYERFKMDERGALSWFLGMQVKQSPVTVTVNQSRYIDDCLERFGLADSKPMGTPADISAQPSKKDCTEAGPAEEVSKKAEDFRGFVGLLVYSEDNKAGYPCYCDAPLQLL